MKNNTKTSKKNVKTAYPTLETLADDINIIHYEFFCQQPEKDYDSGAVINTAPRNNMPYNVAGFYRSDSHDITHPNDRPRGSSFDIFVRSHESIHATYGTTNEYITDCLAAAKTGHYEFVRNGINKHIKF